MSLYSKMIITIALMFSGPAVAQMSVDFSSVGSSVAGITTPVILNPCTGGCGAPAPRRVGTVGRPAATSARLLYQVTPTLAREVADGYVQRIARDPATAKMMAAKLKAHDYRAIYRAQTAGWGLRDNDAIDTMTAYTVLGWMIANNKTSGIDSEMLPGVRAQIAPRFIGDPRLNRSGVPARLSEEMKLLFVTLQSGWQSSRVEGNTREYAVGVANMLRAQSGQDPRRLALTRAGFSDR